MGLPFVFHNLRLFSGSQCRKIYIHIFFIFVSIFAACVDICEVAEPTAISLGHCTAGFGAIVLNPTVLSSLGTGFLNMLHGKNFSYLCNAKDILNINTLNTKHLIRFRFLQPHTSKIFKVRLFFLYPVEIFNMYLGFFPSEPTRCKNEDKDECGGHLKTTRLIGASFLTYD